MAKSSSKRSRASLARNSSSGPRPQANHSKEKSQRPSPQNISSTENNDQDKKKKVIILGMIGLALLFWWFGLYQHPHRMRIQGTLPPGMRIEVEAVYTLSSKGGLGASSERWKERVIARARADDSGNYSLVAEVGRSALFSRPNDTQVTVYLSDPEYNTRNFPLDAPKAMAAQTEPNGGAAVVMKSGWDNTEAAATVRCKKKYWPPRNNDEGSLSTSWECEPPLDLWFGTTGPAGISFPPQAKSFTLDVQIEKRNLKKDTEPQLQRLADGKPL